MNAPKDSLLIRLIGLELVAVVFVRDYLQLHFDGPRLTSYVWPTVHVGGSSLYLGDVGYRDALCAFINQTVVSTEEAVGRGLLLRFATSALSIHPKSAELTGPEIAMLDGFSNMCDVWRPGEDTFADLR
ncbi:hypothetical protein [Nocardia suismassiliense]|uniref:hypothetical protein n=1 Tax=Nocardia suismassiliense TaxID=2077092 RepID=UPI000D1D93F8|nr:hypothetical protein [Nocardia suismassiliense]